MKPLTISELKEQCLNNPEAIAAYEKTDQELELVELLYAMREHAKLNKKQLAELVGVLPSEITRLEKNPSGASIRTLRRYADACGAKISLQLVY